MTDLDTFKSFIIRTRESWSILNLSSILSIFFRSLSARHRVTALTTHAWSLPLFCEVRYRYRKILCACLLRIGTRLCRARTTRWRCDLSSHAKLRISGSPEYLEVSQAFCGFTFGMAENATQVPLVIQGCDIVRIRICSARMSTTSTMRDDTERQPQRRLRISL